MANITSTAIGDGRKSIGNLTYRFVNGRTVASKRVIQNSSQTPEQLRQRMSFTAATQMGKALRTFINIGFERNKNGSPYNQFVHHNKDLMNFVRNNPDYNTDLEPITHLCRIVKDDSFTGKIYSAAGQYDLVSLLNWNIDENLEGVLYYSRELKEGDTVYIGFCFSYILVGSYFSKLKLYSKTLMREDVELLLQPDQFVVNQSVFPDLQVFETLPPGAQNVEVAVTGIVVGQNDRSTSVFMPVPDLPPRFSIAEQTIADGTRMNLIAARPEEFMEALNPEALNGTLLIRSEPGSKHGVEFPVQSLVLDTESNPVGFVVGVNGNSRFKQPLTGVNTGSAAILKDNRILAMLDGIILPEME